MSKLLLFYDPTDGICKIKTIGKVSVLVIWGEQIQTHVLPEGSWRILGRSKEMAPADMELLMLSLNVSEPLPPWTLVLEQV